jgi:hypothetical protein
MAWDTSLPYGMRDTKITPFTTPAATAYGTGVDYPNARTVSFTESEEFNELRGDDTVVAIHGSGPTGAWEMEHGGITIPAYKSMAGGTSATSGTTPAQITTFTKLASDVRPYFKAEGQSISDNGGDFHVILPKCKADGDFTGELNDGEFWLTGASGRMLGSTVTADLNILYKFVLNETAVAIT